MKRFQITISALIMSLISVFAVAQTNASTVSSSPQVLLETSKGTIVVELYPEKAPKTVENFLSYVNDKFYDGTIFHRVIPNFMIQGGGFNQNFDKKITRDPIISEADNGLRNRIGTLAMARTNDPHSATAQFFINVAQNSMLDFKEKSSSRAWGYAVFGKVIKGMHVVNKIRNTPTGYKNAMKDVPEQTITIIKARQIK